MGCAQVSLIVFASFFILVSMGLVGISSWACVQAHMALPAIGIGIGVVILITNIFGIVGSSAEKRPSMRWVLATYFLLTFLVVLATALVGGVYFISKELIIQYLTVAGNALLDYFRSKPEYSEFFKDGDAKAIDAIATYLSSDSILIGAICVGIAVVLIFGLLLSGYILSMKYVVRLLLGFQNLLTLLIGLAITGVGIWGIIAVHNLGSLDIAIWIPIAVVILGALISFVSFLGCCGACAKSRCPLITYAVFMGFIILCVIALVVAIYVFLGQVLKIVMDNIDLLKQVFPQLADMPNFADLVSNFITANFKLLSIALIVFGVFLLWSFVSSIYLTVKFGQPEESDSLLAHSDLDGAANYALAGSSVYGVAVHSAYVPAYPVPASKTRAQTFY